MSKKTTQLRKRTSLLWINFKQGPHHTKCAYTHVEVRDIAYILDSFDRIFTSLLEEITTNAGKNDLIWLSIRTPQLDYPIQLPFMKKKDLTVGHILDKIERVLQSDEEFTLDDGIDIDTIQVHNPNGGRLKARLCGFGTFSKRKAMHYSYTKHRWLCAVPELSWQLKLA